MYLEFFIIKLSLIKYLMNFSTFIAINKKRKMGYIYNNIKNIYLFLFN